MLSLQASALNVAEATRREQYHMSSKKLKTSELDTHQKNSQSEQRIGSSRIHSGHYHILRAVLKRIIRECA